MAEISSLIEKSQAGLYKGSRMPGFHARPLEEIEDELRRNVGRIDDLLFYQMGIAVQEGKQSITFLDIGSGEGRLFRDILGKPQLCPKTRGFLKDYSHFNLRIVGLTDSPTSADHLTKQPISAPEAEQIIAENVYYSLSRRQALWQFLDSQHIGAIDLALASQSLRYLSVRVFKEVVETVASRLSSHGQFVAWGFHEDVPGFTPESADYESKRKGKSAPKLMIRKFDPNEPSLKSMLAFRPMGGSAEEIERALEKAWQLYKRLGVLTDERIDKERTYLEGMEYYRNLGHREQLLELANQTLGSTPWDLYGKKRRANLAKKRAILHNLPGVKVEYFDFQNLGKESRGFVIARGVEPGENIQYFPDNKMPGHGNVNAGEINLF